MHKSKSCHHEAKPKKDDTIKHINSNLRFTSLQTARNRLKSRKEIPFSSLQEARYKYKSEKIDLLSPSFNEISENNRVISSSRYKCFEKSNFESSFRNVN